MPRDDHAAKLEQLVDGEMGQAELYGLFCLAYACLYEMIDSRDYDRMKAAIKEARRLAPLLAVPESVPADAREEWKHTAALAVDYFQDFMPPFDDDPPKRPKRPSDDPDDYIEF